MKEKKAVLIKILFMFLVVSCKTGNLTPDSADIVFKNANVITMSSNEVLKNKSVYVSNGVIKEIGDFTDLNFPEGTAIINSKGKYLTPGFSDMHSHIYEEQGLSLFLSNGVTTIRNMWGRPWHLKTRAQIRNGELLGPDIFTTGSLTDGKNAMQEGSYILTDPEKVEDYVISIKDEGYDFIKIYDNLSPEVLANIMEFAQVYEIPVVGHVPLSVDLRDAIRLGLSSTEHLKGYNLWYYTISEYNDRIDHTLESGLWNCPTLVTIKQYSDLYNGYQKPENYSMESTPNLKYVNPYLLDRWKNSTPFDMYYEESIVLLKILHDSGANIVSGSDHTNPYVIAGFSLHDEFELLNQAGLSPYEVLLTTTVNPAKMLGVEDSIGTIEVGKDADLVLLEENPLEDIKNTKSISGVMVKGKWLDQERLKKMLKEVEKSYPK